MVLGIKLEIDKSSVKNAGKELKEFIDSNYTPQKGVEFILNKVFNE